MPELRSRHGRSWRAGDFDPWSWIRGYRPGFWILGMIKIEEMEKNSISKLLLEKKNVFFLRRIWIRSRKKFTRLHNSGIIYMYM